MSTDRVLELEGVNVSYGKVQALRDIDLHVDPGEVVGVIGPNGAGKSTLSDTIAGFKPYDTGTVQFRGTEVSTLTPDKLTEDRVIYCTERRDLFGFMTVAENLRLGAYTNRDNLKDRLEFVYDLFPRLDERREQDARTLSGGEQQMLAIGRALMGSPEFLILDEPTIGLAPVIIDDITNALEQIQEEENVTILLCEQNVTFTFRHADRIYLLEKGSIAREGTAEALRQDKHVKDAYIG
ncbi:ABC transporter ATP-binding protein [Halobacteria archaeon AArc-curdl1]|uniref:ABC transporter ATP-binding protein n=1 Tax=Natronosalvus hydrolyticus TaxID=2979988 RepID=A0AAP2ZAD4_9EURY|nr:ABC transporter ATP-binding protein [Halobacteria archaeon AArc-curdl1]